MLIIPAILTNQIDELTALEKKAEGIVDRVQIDVIDHKFADNITVDPLLLRKDHTILNLDYHLMVKSPSEWIENCIRSETFLKDRIIGQIEEMENQGYFVDRVLSLKSIPGLAVDLPTGVDKLDQSVLSKVEVVLLMSVKAGWGGQEFDLETFRKIEKLVRIREELNMGFKILVDGGVTKELVKEMENAGVDEVAVGQRIFEPDLKGNLDLFKNGKN